jgi:phenylalanyl-tRNA synthetase alpha chain
MVTYTTIEKDQYNLTEEGNDIADTGSHEAKVFNAVDAKDGISIADLAVSPSFVGGRRHLWHLGSPHH